MGQASNKSMEDIRKKVHSYLAALTPEEAKTLRARFGLSPMGQAPDTDEEALRALAGQLARLKKKL
jgi:DNA-directed RNA polymerase sigma subunit (sigma70/sigma32)